jgi:4-diphosphocytidyl-2-C-methyl-D-erythritol kinase
MLGVFAPAKINLYLHVVGRRADGYHLLDSLIAFADIGDRVTAGPADRLSLTVTGPEAAAVSALGDDNLVLRAARLLAEAAAVRSGARLDLDKRLPASSGIGGGSSDAAATLRLLDQLWQCRFDRDALRALGVKLGADVPACIAATPVRVGGIGERLEAAAGLPAAGIVLANPRRPLPTAAVFAARRGAFSREGRVTRLPEDAAALAAMLAERRNDLTEAAAALVPQIVDVLDRLTHLPGALLARMSGSGATCFALFADRAAALAAGAIFAEQNPEWWSAAGALLTAPPPVEFLGGAAAYPEA